MATPYTVFLARPSTDAYDPSCQPAAQPRKAEIDPTFFDAMTVRHAVFILEQKVPLESEIDEDDPRSCHWVAYPTTDGAEGAVPREPVGTIRVVPYPQAPHPTPGAAYSIVDGAFVVTGRWVKKSDRSQAPDPGMPQSELDFIPAGEDSAVPPEEEERATSLHDGKEPYVKLGRIAVVQSARGTGLGLVLVQTTLDWIQANPTFFDEHDSQAAAATATTKFNGLVCLHAQAYAMGFYKKLGFEVDEQMGTWWEEGMQHVGMFRRLDIHSA